MLALPKHMIAAVDLMGGFSKDNQIPWDCPEDLRMFKSITNGGICLMGRTTYEDLNDRMGERGKDKVLPGRDSYVVSSTLDPDTIKNARVVRSVEQLHVDHITDQQYDNNVPFFFIGGSRVFDLAINQYADVIHLTIFNSDYDCDRHIDLATIMKLFAVAHTRPLQTVDAKYFKLVRLGK